MRDRLLLMLSVLDQWCVERRLRTFSTAYNAVDNYSMTVRIENPREALMFRLSWWPT